MSAEEAKCPLCGNVLPADGRPCGYTDDPADEGDGACGWSEREWAAPPVSPGGVTTPTDEAVEMAARILHDAYEAAAPSNGWETQQRSRVEYDDLPQANRQTMLDAVSSLLAAISGGRVPGYRKELEEDPAGLSLAEMWDRLYADGRLDLSGFAGQEPIPQVGCGECGEVIDLPDVAQRWLRKRARALIRSLPSATPPPVGGGLGEGEPR